VSGGAGPMATRRGAALLLALAMAGTTARAAAPERVEVWREPTCGCCEGWIQHMREAGFEVTVRDVADMRPVKAASGVPEALLSCHTAAVGGYVVEGHVPAVDVRRLLSERPALRGLAAVGMPRGAPGMEVWGAKPQPYSVTALDKQGKTSVFATHGS